MATEHPRRTKRPLDRVEWWAILGLGLLLLLASGVPLVTSYAVGTDAIERGEVQLTSTCPHKVRHGTPCPTCGMTRAFTSASRGRLGDAWRYNRGALPLYGLAWLTLLGSGAAVAISTRRLVPPRP